MRASFFSSIRLFATVAAIIVLPSTACFGWGSEGHRMINRLAAEHLPPDLPAFLHSAAAIEEIEYLGPEPDRWRSPGEPELSNEQAPEHFIDLELADMIGNQLPRRRYDFIAALYAAGLTHPNLAAELRPEKVGLQPYVTTEVYERLKAAMREYRALSAQGKDTKPVEQAIVFYAGWLGHYVGDGSQPLHVTLNYDGWVGKENPKGYTTQRGIHAKFETTFVAANIRAADVAPLMSAPMQLNDVFDDYVAYLRSSARLIERTYELEKLGGFDNAGTVDSKQFTAQRLAAAASELRDLYYTAWVESAKPVPDWHDAPKPPPTATKPTSGL
jgi:S1/P1 Nuclease